MCIDPSTRSHDNSRLCSGGADKIVQLTDVGTGQPIRKYRGHISVSYTYFMATDTPLLKERGRERGGGREVGRARVHTDVTGSRGLCPYAHAHNPM